MKTSADSFEHFHELLSIISRLRGPDGCPWDRAQTKTDIGRYLVEEAYEAIEALEKSSPDDLREELGDLLFQILFLARMAEESGEFSIADILSDISSKMVRRHPHVFGDATADNVEDVRSNWDRIKALEKPGRRKASPVCGDIPCSLPTLAKVQLITERVAEVGFDWKDISGVLDKVAEELAEFRSALEMNDPARLQGEAGDLIFTVVNLCRCVRVDAESALRGSLRKFIYRFSKVEQELAARGKTPQDSTLAEMDRIWEAVKKNSGETRK